MLDRRVSSSSHKSAREHRRGHACREKAWVPRQHALSWGIYVSLLGDLRSPCKSEPCTSRERDGVTAYGSAVPTEATFHILANPRRVNWFLLTFDCGLKESAVKESSGRLIASQGDSRGVPHIVLAVYSMRRHTRPSLRVSVSVSVSPLSESLSLSVLLAASCPPPPACRANCYTRPTEFIVYCIYRTVSVP